MSKMVDKLIEMEAMLMELKVRACRKSFLEYCKYFDPEFFTQERLDAYAGKVIQSFQDLHDGKIKKLAISLPPRAGKSYIASLFCAWSIGKNPTKAIMRNSYSYSLAKKFSQHIQGFIQSAKFLSIFKKIRLKYGREAVEDWSIEDSKADTTYFCAGTGGSITGKGATMYAILDDPIKNFEEALSENRLKVIWDWYTSTHKSRFEHGCKEVHIATRWSKSDPIGKLLDSGTWEDGVNGCRVIVVPALDKDGKSFFEGVKTTEEYQELKEITDPVIWEAEFMQNPIAVGSLAFPVDELKRFKKKDIEGLAVDGKIMFCDVADEGADFLSAPVGYIIGDRVYITDVCFTREPVEITADQVAAKIVDHDINISRFESNSGGGIYAKDVEGKVKGHSTCEFEKIFNTANKHTRIIMQSGYIKKRFYFLEAEEYKKGSEYEKFLENVATYTRMGKNKHDDGPDSLAGLAAMIRDDYDGKTEVSTVDL